VYATMFNKYPRPIPTPVENLRPAQETCEECHWPRRFLGDQFKVITHFGTDEKNTPRQIRLLIKTGGGDPTTGMARGIHWHMNIGNEITYAETDPKREDIPWVKIRDLQTGEVTIYQAKDTTVTAQQIEKAPKHRMDCIDCHNRPTHIYVPPDRSVDQSLLAKRLNPAMPCIKQQAVVALTAEYKTTDEAMQGIATSLTNFYSAKYPEYAAGRRDELETAVKEVQRIFAATTFPEMKVDWKTHPDNIGHFYFNGCFRCHDGQHVAASGKAISNDCTICHSIVEQEQGSATTSVTGVKFNHPGGELPEGVKCMDCHTGGVGP
jgi:hypothetical protein